MNAGPQASRLPDDLFSSPRLLPFDYDLRSGAALLLPMSRAAYARHSFLDTRIGPGVRLAGRVPIQALLRVHARWRAQGGVEPKPLRFIFHTAFCASTLLARCLDHPGVTIAYKEPLALHRVSGLQRNRLASLRTARAIPRSRYESLLHVTLDLLSRTFNPDAAPIVKSTDSTNHIAPDILARHPQTRAILLYSDLRSFLVSSLKAPQRRAYTRSLLWRARVDAAQLGLFQDGPVPADEDLTDAQAAAFVWTVQLQLYRSLLDDAQLALALRTLDTATFLAEPGATLAAGASHLSLDLHDEHISGAIERTMSRHAKVPSAAYTPEDAARERASLEDALAAEIGEGEAMLAALARLQPLSFPLDAPLL